MVQEYNPDSKIITVVGAGIIGLSVAYQLITNTEYDVVIIAEEFVDSSAELSTGYTSTRAGAHFRPAPSLTDSDIREANYNRFTQQVFEKMTIEEPQSSIRIVDAEEFFETPSEHYTGLSRGYKEGIKDFQTVPEHELPTGIKFGTKYKAWVLNPPVLLNYITLRLRQSGRVTFITSKLESLSAAQKIVPNSYRTINCSGSGLQWDGSHDPESFSIRGQTMLLKEFPSQYSTKTVTYQLKENKWCFVIPRPLGGGLILGGTKRPDLTSSEPLDSEMDELAANAAKFFPDLDTRSANVAKINVGFRPARHGGSRVEVDAEHPHLIHAYGVGGAGFEMSFGLANHVLALVLSPSRSKL